MVDSENGMPREWLPPLEDEKTLLINEIAAERAAWLAEQEYETADPDA